MKHIKLILSSCLASMTLDILWCAYHFYWSFKAWLMKIICQYIVASLGNFDKQDPGKNIYQWQSTFAKKVQITGKFDPFATLRATLQRNWLCYVRKRNRAFSSVSCSRVSWNTCSSSKAASNGSCRKSCPSQFLFVSLLLLPFNRHRITYIIYLYWERRISFRNAWIFQDISILYRIRNLTTRNKKYPCSIETCNNIATTYKRL